MKTTGFVDVIYINNVIWTVGVWKGERGNAKGGPVVGRPEKRVDGYLSPQEKKLVLK
jgi:hypothetical protein